MRNEYRILEGTPEWKRLLGRPGHSLENNIKRDFKEIGYEDVNQNHMAEDSDQWQEM
jgi:hypothetical protein